MILFLVRLPLALRWSSAIIWSIRVQPQPFLSFAFQNLTERPQSMGRINEGQERSLSPKGPIICEGYHLFCPVWLWSLPSQDTICHCYTPLFEIINDLIQNFQSATSVGTFDHHLSSNNECAYLVVCECVQCASLSWTFSGGGTVHKGVSHLRCWGVTPALDIAGAWMRTGRWSRAPKQPQESQGRTAMVWMANKRERERARYLPWDLRLQAFVWGFFFKKIPVMYSFSQPISHSHSHCQRHHHHHPQVFLFVFAWLHAHKCTPKTRKDFDYYHCYYSYF